jgi:hypothetical protein
MSTGKEAQTRQGPPDHATVASSVSLRASFGRLSPRNARKLLLFRAHAFRRGEQVPHKGAEFQEFRVSGRLPKIADKAK